MSALHGTTDIIASLSREDVLHALREIDRDGVPPKRRSTKICLSHGGRHYPRRPAISFGSPSNTALSALGFAIVACKCGGQSKAVHKPIPSDVNRSDVFSVRGKSE